MRTITTRNSVYEINESARFIRRTTGANDPTPHFGEDGVWQPYLTVKVPAERGGFLIVWSSDGRATWTSNILSDSSDDLS
jgi:hypothetical protein